MQIHFAMNILISDMTRWAGSGTPLVCVSQCMSFLMSAINSSAIKHHFNYNCACQMNESNINSENLNQPHTATASLLDQRLGGRELLICCVALESHLHRCDKVASWVCGGHLSSSDDSVTSRRIRTRTELYVLFINFAKSPSICNSS